jgi:hypothetical protein
MTFAPPERLNPRLTGGSVVMASGQGLRPACRNAIKNCAMHNFFLTLP